jgi:hypothetical protein
MARDCSSTLTRSFHSLPSVEPPAPREDRPAVLLFISQDMACHFHCKNKSCVSHPDVRNFKTPRASGRATVKKQTFVEPKFRSSANFVATQGRTRSRKCYRFAIGFARLISMLIHSSEVSLPVQNVLMSDKIGVGCVRSKSDRTTCTCIPASTLNLSK